MATVKLRKLITAEVTLRRDKRRDNGSVSGRVPGRVTEALQARDGDRLVFDEGCDRSVQVAALKGPYFVVRLERAPEPEAEPDEVREIWR